MTPQQKEIIEGNTLIAEFMEYFEKSIAFAQRKKIKYDWKKDLIELESLTYHKSWDMLMPVVDKTEESDTPYYIEIVEQHCYIYNIDLCDDKKQDAFIITDGKTKIESVWNAVIKFIKQNKK